MKTISFILNLHKSLFFEIVFRVALSLEGTEDGVDVLQNEHGKEFQQSGTVKTQWRVRYGNIHRQFIQTLHLLSAIHTRINDR